MIYFPIIFSFCVHPQNVSLCLRVCSDKHCSRDPRRPSCQMQHQHSFLPLIIPCSPGTILSIYDTYKRHSNYQFGCRCQNVYGHIFLNDAFLDLFFVIHYFLSRMLLRYAFSRLRSTQVAVVHCSAQTSSRHVLQKLGQTCLLLSSNTGRVFRPKDCENLVLYLKDINLPKPDKWGTSNLTSFLQQVKGHMNENTNRQFSEQCSD